MHSTTTTVAGAIKNWSGATNGPQGRIWPFLLLSVPRKQKERKKEGKKERMINGYFFEHLVLAYTFELMNDLGLIR